MPLSCGSRRNRRGRPNTTKRRAKSLFLTKSSSKRKGLSLEKPLSLDASSSGSETSSVFSDTKTSFLESSTARSEESLNKLAIVCSRFLTEVTTSASSSTCQSEIERSSNHEDDRLRTPRTIQEWIDLITNRDPLPPPFPRTKHKPSERNEEEVVSVDVRLLREILDRMKSEETSPREDSDEPKFELSTPLHTEKRPDFEQSEPLHIAKQPELPVLNTPTTPLYNEKRPDAEPKVSTLLAQEQPNPLSSSQEQPNPLSSSQETPNPTAPRFEQSAPLQTEMEPEEADKTKRLLSIKVMPFLAVASLPFLWNAFGDRIGKQIEVEYRFVLWVLGFHAYPRGHMAQ